MPDAYIQQLIWNYFNASKVVTLKGSTKQEIFGLLTRAEALIAILAANHRQHGNTTEQTNESNSNA